MALSDPIQILQPWLMQNSVLFSFELISFEVTKINDTATPTWHKINLHNMKNPLNLVLVFCKS